MEMLEAVGIQDLAGKEASSLPYGDQRLLEIARDPRHEAQNCSSWTSLPPA